MKSKREQDKLFHESKVKYEILIGIILEKYLENTLASLHVCL